MRFISDDYSYSPIDLSKFADAHRTEICPMCNAQGAATLNGVALSRCALCKGAGRKRIALVECDDCKRLTDSDDARPVYAGPGEDRGEALYRVLCIPCDDLDTAHLEAVERDERKNEQRPWRW